jgi:hypothetical protein
LIPSLTYLSETVESLTVLASGVKWKSLLRPLFLGLHLIPPPVSMSNNLKEMGIDRVSKSYVA